MSRLGKGFAAAVLCGVLAPATAQATVTVGSSLTNATNLGGTHPNPLVWVQDVVHPFPVGYRQASPVNGTVVLWRTRGTRMNASSNTLQLRVLQPSGNGYIGAGTSDPQTLPNAADDDALREFGTSLPIHAGDEIGLGAAGSAYVPAFHPPFGAPGITGFYAFSDGSPSDGHAAASSGELQANAEVEPTNTFSLSPIQRNKKNGTATVTANLPNAGTFEVQGGLIAPQTVDVAAPGNLALTLQPMPPIRRQLKKQGKALVDATFVYAPSFGKHRAQSVTFTLKQKRKKKRR
ncbi:MAG: hypothetical protein ACJ75Z_10425 [Solirubrobacterales bacterium]